MNKGICWFCKKEFEYDGNKYRDVHCPHCKIMNSYYDPTLALDPGIDEMVEEPQLEKPRVDPCEECKKSFIDGKIPGAYCNICSKKPIKQELITKEEEVINYGDEKYQGKTLFMPPVGQTIELEIVELAEVKSDNPKMNFRDKVPVTQGGEQVVDDDGEPVFKEKDLGYHIEAKLKNGKTLVINSLAQLNQVFKKHNIQDGDKVRIFHKDKGEWVVEKL